MSNDLRKGSPLKIDLQSTASPTKFTDLDSSIRKDKESALRNNDKSWKEVEEKKFEIDQTISHLDDKLNLVLAKQEYEYLKGYNIYVKRKEKELRELIDKLNEKNSNATLKDDKINNLEKTVQSIREDQIKMQKDKDEQLKKIKHWTSKAQNLEQERDFLQKQVLESKRQNKLLKMAIQRLQSQMSVMPATSQQQIDIEMQGHTFLTEGKLPDVQIDSARIHASAKPVDHFGISTI